MGLDSSTCGTFRINFLLARLGVVDRSTIGSTTLTSGLTPIEYHVALRIEVCPAFSGLDRNSGPATGSHVVYDGAVELPWLD